MSAQENYADKYAAQTEPQRQPQISEACVSMEHALEAASKTLVELEQRLKPLLRNEPEAAGSDVKEARTLVPMAAQIQSYVVHLQQIERDYRSILRRLEL